MKYRKLGNTGIEVSEIGFGAWGIGGDSYGKADDNVSKETLRRAYLEGITFYDTSDIYGSGHSEELIGQVFSRVRDKVVIATKGGTLPHFNLPMPQDFSAKHLRETLEASLKRLQTDYIDLYQLHSPPIEILSQSDAIPTLQLFQKEGKIRAFGVSVRSPKDAFVAVRFCPSVIQANFNLIDQRALRDGLLKLLDSWRIGFIARTPLCFGFLTGRYLPDAKFGRNDHRGNWPKEQIERWAKAPELFSFLKDGNEGQTYAQLALRFCLSYPISTTIPGMMTPEEVRENVKASGFGSLAKSELAEVNKVYRSNTFYVGRG